MSQQLALTPAGALILIPDDAAAAPCAALASAQQLFVDGEIAHAMFTLAAEPPERKLAPSYDFWREFACDYLRARCR